jgi:large subunit ribosomal protein L17
MAYRNLGMDKSHREAMFRNMVTSFLREGKVTTTQARAKELRRLTDKMITLGKRGDLHARRQAVAFINDKDVVKKLFDDIAPKYAGRNGGYTRTIKIGPRRGDAAEMVLIELVD